MELGKAVYEASKAQAESGEGTNDTQTAGDSGSGGDDDVIDAEYVVKDEPKD